LLIALAGELSTLLSDTKRPAQFATYRHEQLRESFEPVMTALRDCLSKTIDSPAIPLPLKERRFGIRVAQLGDPGLIDQANFVLAVHADIPVEELQRKLPAQIKIGSVENIRELVNVQLPGIRIRPLPVAPRQIPFHAGNVYFELDPKSEYWANMKGSGGFAIHIGGEFPGLSMEFWAIRG
jgi:type VI secretion system protein ImpJ